MKRLSLRVSDDFYKRLIERAERDGRSLNAQIVFEIEEQEQHLATLEARIAVLETKNNG